MKHGRIADTEAGQAFAVWADDDITAVQKEEDMAAEVASIERLIAEVDRELEEQERTEQVRVTRKFTDVRSARRAHRRAEAGVLRELPVRLPAALPLDGEAA